jgi:glycosyltransferase involved in cell wall biosynthesis
MTINIITPTYNDTKFLLNTLNSICEIKENRIDLNINFIIVDNISTDNSVEFLGGYKNPNIVNTLIREKDKGIYDVMNKGLDACQEGHVLFLGAGDMIITLPKTLEDETVYYGTTIVHNSNYFVSSLDNYFTNTYGTLHHQSMLVPLIFHRHFNTLYKICADYAHNIEMLIENRRFEFSSELLSYHMPGGASSNLKSVRKERKIIQKRAKDFLINGILPSRI